MLSALTISNFAIVSSLNLDFTSGMSAFTGETGAGKSIMIDALMLALGGRADTSVIRKDADKCDISACFNVLSDDKPNSWLEAHDLETDAGDIVLRRVLYQNGRSKAYINGQVFPLQKVKEIASLLVDIHGQHQHQSLLNHNTHRQQLDNFGKHTHELKELAEIYKEYQQQTKALNDLQNSDTNAEKKALLEYQIAELNELDVKAHEIEELNQEHQLLTHAQEYLQQSRLITNILKDQDENNVCSELNHVQKLLENLATTKEHHILNSIEMVQSALIQCEEAFSEVESFAKNVHLDPERLLVVENRVSAVHTAARKYQVAPDKLTEHSAKLQNELAQIHHTSQQKTEIVAKVAVLKEGFNKKAQVLRKLREKAANKMAAEITSIIQRLGMPKGYIEIKLTPVDKMTAHGLDHVEYQVCTNPGLEPNSLSKVASGGELSRISLAIQMIAAQRGATPTLLFDEVDVGIGGATAALVGDMLRNLGNRLQLFCVTHQPQVASKAHHHFKVEKHSHDNKTYSEVKLLKDNNRVNEIARMLGGVEVTNLSRKNAQEMLETA